MRLVRTRLQSHRQASRAYAPKRLVAFESVEPTLGLACARTSEDLRQNSDRRHTDPAVTSCAEHAHHTRGIHLRNCCVFRDLLRAGRQGTRNLGLNRGIALSSLARRTQAAPIHRSNWYSILTGQNATTWASFAVDRAEVVARSLELVSLVSLRNTVIGKDAQSW